MTLYSHINEILKQPLVAVEGCTIGTSVKGRSIQGFKFGKGLKNISLIAGNHADEPIGPLLLKKLVSYLSNLPKTNSLLKNYSWYIVPHTNPDGEFVNKKWYSYKDKNTDLAEYLINVVREPPGKDLEFGYPIDKRIAALRPENTAVYNFWKTAKAPFNLHVSLHGMAKAYGAWFLINRAWANKTYSLQQQCAKRTSSLGYDLFDLDRHGEKGFYRIAEGFCSCPSAKGMQHYFLNRNEPKMANKFHANSMESIRSLGGDCLSLVSEMPLFLFPKKERPLVWPNTYLQEWSAQFSLWKSLLISGDLSASNLTKEMQNLNIKPMPWDDQLRLQWQLIASGIECINNT